MASYFLSMVKDTDIHEVCGTGEESAVADAVGPVRTWDLVSFTFYPVGQVSQTNGPELVVRSRDLTKTRSSDGTEEVFSGATGS